MASKQGEAEKAGKLKVLVLDDDRLSSHNLSIQLRFVGETPMVSTSENWQQMFGMLAERGESDRVLAVALGQIRKVDLLDLLLNLHHYSPRLPLLLLSDLANEQLSQLPESLQERLLPLGDGSLHYQKLLDALQTARRIAGRPAGAPPLRSKLISDTGTALFRSLSGQSAAIQQVRQSLAQVATREASVLVIGESGTGKEIVARNIHYHSGRGEKPFVAVNCAALAPERHGMELFGQEAGPRGEPYQGLVEKAHGGTLFLDEIADMPLHVQSLLLRFLEERQFQRLGGDSPLQVDVRVVAATRQNLEQKITAGEFREDLYYRISVVPIALPPLRQRREDIPELVSELISSLENRAETSLRFNSQALLSLQQHHWPGNVRELANLVERLGIMQPNAMIGLGDLPPEYQYPVPDPDLEKPAEPAAVSDDGDAAAAAVSRVEPMPNFGSSMPPLSEEHLQQYLDNFERQLLEVALEDSAGMIEFAAERLRMAPALLQTRMQELGIAERGSQR